MTAVRSRQPNAASDAEKEAEISFIATSTHIFHSPFLEFVSIFVISISRLSFLASKKPLPNLKINTNKFCLSIFDLV